MLPDSENRYNYNVTESRGIVDSSVGNWPLPFSEWRSNRATRPIVNLMWEPRAWPGWTLIVTHNDKNMCGIRDVSSGRNKSALWQYPVFRNKSWRQAYCYLRSAPHFCPWYHAIQITIGWWWYWQSLNFKPRSTRRSNSLVTVARLLYIFLRPRESRI